MRTLVPAPTQEEAQVVYSPILYPSSLYRPASSPLCPPREEELYVAGGGFKIERERLRLGSFCAMNYRIRFIASLLSACNRMFQGEVYSPMDVLFEKRKTRPGGLRASVAFSDERVKPVVFQYDEWA